MTTAEKSTRPGAYVHANGIDIYYEEYGSGYSLLLIHSAMFSVRCPWLLARAVTRIVAVFVAVVVALLPLVSYAGTITVDGTTCNLPDAIAAANTDAAAGDCAAGSGADTLLLTATTYSLATGPFDSSEFGSTAAPTVTSTIIISGGVDGATVERSGAGQYRLFHVGSTGNLTVQNITLRYGNTDWNGGAIYNQGALTLLNSHLISNTALLGGGGIYNLNSTAILTNSDFISNTAGNGGGLYNERSTASLINSNFIANRATEAGGGGLFNLYSTANLTNCSFIANTAPRLGGGLSNNGAANLTNCSFIANTITETFPAAEGGGGLYNNGGLWDNGHDNNSLITVNLTNARFIANSAAQNGGGLYNSPQGMATLTNTDFISNTSNLNGGGLYNYGQATLTNAHFVSNTADNGGGFLNDYSAATLANVHFIANTARLDGGGFYNYGQATLTNAHFVSNTADNGGGIFNNSGNITLILASAHFISNTANLGGGIFNFGTTTLTNSEIRANIAISSGAGLYQDGNQLTSPFVDSRIVGSRILDNAAGDTGGALQQLFGSTSIAQSCIENNSDTAVNYVSGEKIEASHNWWGAPAGPSGAGPGAGDSVSSNVTFSPLLTAGCPLPAEEQPSSIYLPHVER